MGPLSNKGRIHFFSQSEYNRVLDTYSARLRGCGQKECERILMENGASAEQAKNGAYVYLHHNGNRNSLQKGSQEEYERILREFGADIKRPRECIKHLEKLGFSYGQSKTAVYNYRKSNGLIGNNR